MSSSACRARGATMISRSMSATTPRIAGEQPEHDAAGAVTSGLVASVADGADDPLDGVGEVGRPVRIGERVARPWATRLAVGARRSRRRPHDDRAVGRGITATRSVRRSRATTTSVRRDAVGDRPSRRVAPSSPPRTAVGEARRRVDGRRVGRAIRRTRRVDPDPTMTGCAVAGSAQRRSPPRWSAGTAAAVGTSACSGSDDVSLADGWRRGCRRRCGAAPAVPALPAMSRRRERRRRAAVPQVPTPAHGAVVASSSSSRLAIANPPTTITATAAAAASPASTGPAAGDRAERRRAAHRDARRRSRAARRTWRARRRSLRRGSTPGRAVDVAEHAARRRRSRSTSASDLRVGSRPAPARRRSTSPSR